MSKIWFTSDQHFYHTRIIEYCKRPFDSVEHMNEEIVRRHNTVVCPGDTVWHLGDFSLAHRAVTVFLPRLHGNHHLIMGNHDHCHPAHYKNKHAKGIEMRALYYSAGFKTLSMEDTFDFPHGILTDLHHMPYAPLPGAEAYDTRYLEYRPKDRGNYLLHGHVHEKWRKKGKMINVGVDVWDFTPVSIDQIMALISKGWEHNE